MHFVLYVFLTHFEFQKMADEYAFASKSALKLKGVEPQIKKKKKKKDKDRDREKVEKSLGEGSSSSTGEELVDNPSDEDPMFRGKTPSEVAYLKKKREVELERIKKKANLNHKEKVEKFNSYLNNLSEHYDIMKVSWTK